MDNKELFKEFVKKNPRLINYVHNGDMTWQKFYEIYDLYGEDKEAWKNYLTEESTNSTVKAAATTAGTIGLVDVVNWLKNINLDNFQSGISNLQRVMGVVQDFTSKSGDTTETTKEAYKPRPLYRHFED